MKTFFFLALAVVVMTALAGVFFWQVREEGGGHENIAPRGTIAWGNHGSREDYINFLLRTENHSNPELWRRIEAVKQLKTWER